MKVDIKKVCVPVFCICALAICPDALAWTHVWSPIDVNTTWDLNGSPYCLKARIPIGNGATLTIQPGVKVGADAYRIIEVDDGSLIANGVEHEPYDEKDYYVGIEVPNTKGDVNLSDCNAFGHVEFHDGSSGTVEDSTINYVVITGDGQRTVSPNNTIGYIRFDSAGDPAATITNNTFTDEAPLRIADPDLDTSGITGNRYEPNSIVRISGTLHYDKTLARIDGQLRKYKVYRDFTVASGATLTIEPGLELEAEHPEYELHTKGSLVAPGNALNTITFSRGLRTFVYGGGSIDLSHCNVTQRIEESRIDWQDGSSGTVEYSEIDGCVIIRGAGTRKMFNNTIGHIRLHDEPQAGCIAYNEITDSEPLRIYDPDMDVNGICLNKYTGSDPNIVIRDQLDRDYTLGFIDGLGGYRIILYKDDGDLSIASGATLTLVRGVVVEAKSGFDLSVRVDGSLDANGVTFLGNLGILVNHGALANLWDCDLRHAGVSIDCKTGSSGILEYCRLNQLKIDGGASFSIVNNDFSLGSVTAEGEPNATIDMKYNWWGTTEPNEIEEKILDCNDDSENKPCVHYEPLLLVPPPDLAGCAADFEPDGDVDLFDFAYFAEHWSETNCGCSNWCGGADLDRNWHVEFLDLAALTENWLAVIPGPAEGNLDGDANVDFADLAIFALAWSTEDGDALWNPACDIGILPDNFINMLDLAVLVDNWLAGCCN